MASPVKLYQQEMHNNVGFFATWLPASTLELGDVGVLEAGRFRHVGSLKELGIVFALRDGSPQDMSYAAAADRKLATSAQAGSAAPVAKAELSIRFTRQGGYVFEVLGARNVQIEDRLRVADEILSAYAQRRWQKEWLVVDAVYQAASATIIVSEDNSSEIVLNAAGTFPPGSVPLADPKLGLSVSASSGKIVHVVAKNNLTPLFSCFKVRDPLIGSPTVTPVRGVENRSLPVTRSSIDELLDS